MRTNLFSTILLFFFFVSLNAQVDMAVSDGDSEGNSKTKFINMNNGIYLLQGEEENMVIYLEKDGVILFDLQSEEDMKRNFRIIDRLSKKQSIKYLISTSPIFKNYQTFSALKKDGTLTISYEASENKKESSKYKNSIGVASNITFSSNLNFRYADEVIKIIPINKEGNSIVYFSKSNIIYTGDVFSKGKYPSLGGNTNISADFISQALSKIIAIGDAKTKIIPGYGEAGTMNDVIFTNKMLGTVYKQIIIQRGNGKSIEDVLSMKNITKNYDAKGFGNGKVTTEMFVRALYKEAEKEFGPVDNRTPEEKAMARLKEMRKEKEAKDKGNKK